MLSGIARRDVGAEPGKFVGILKYAVKEGSERAISVVCRTRRPSFVAVDDAVGPRTEQKWSVRSRARSDATAAKEVRTDCGPRAGGRRSGTEGERGARARAGRLIVIGDGDKSRGHSAENQTSSFSLRIPTLPSEVVCLLCIQIYVNGLASLDISRTRLFKSTG